MYRVYANTKEIIEAWKGRVQPTGWVRGIRMDRVLAIGESEVCAGDWRVEAL